MKNIYLKLEHRCKYCDCLSAYADCTSSVSVQNTSTLYATFLQEGGHVSLCTSESPKSFPCVRAETADGHTLLYKLKAAKNYLP